MPSSKVKNSQKVKKNEYEYEVKKILDDRETTNSNGEVDTEFLINWTNYKT